MVYYKQCGKLIGVLNDRDLAATMNISEASPEKQWFARTGTLPFLALELLDPISDKLSRWFRHDLESCMWCLVWQALTVKPKAWCHEDLSKISLAKTKFISSLSISIFKEEWDPYSKFIFRWERTFRNRIFARWDSLGFTKTEEEEIKISHDADTKENDAPRRQ